MCFHIQKWRCPSRRVADISVHQRLLAVSRVPRRTPAAVKHWSREQALPKLPYGDRLLTVFFSGTYCGALQVKNPRGRLAHVLFEIFTAREVIGCVDALKDQAQQNYGSVDGNHEDSVDIVKLV